jgi:predicted nucleotidyltransferase
VETQKQNKVIVRMLGGSRAYGLENPESDYDYRGVFLNTDLNYILGLDKYEHQEFIEGEDTKLKELRHFLNMLKVSNTEAMEIMFADTFLEADPLFLELQSHRYSLLDTDRAFKCLKGYMQGERRLAFGERTGRLGSKRKTELEKHQFSRKNVVQLLRLAWCGGMLFQEGIFPVNVKKYDEKLSVFLLDIKNNPENYTKEQLQALVDNAEEKLNQAYDTRKFNYTFDMDLANKFVLKSYYPLLSEFLIVS